MKTPEVSKEEFLEAISTGVMHGIVSLVCRDDFNGKYLGKTPQERFLDCIKEGIQEAFSNLEIPSHEAELTGIMHDIPRIVESIDDLNKTLQDMREILKHR